MSKDEQAELNALDAAEREGQVLTGAQRGRLADLRHDAILAEMTARQDRKLAGLPHDIEFRAALKRKD